MSFRERLRPASYRGVPFFVDDDEDSGGKRAQVHEYPGRDEPWVEELGKRAREIGVTAHLLGDDVFEQRTRLQSACEQSGAGKLVLPSRGELLATCVEFRSRESITGEGRISRLELVFIAAGRNQFPGQTADTRELARTAGDGTIAAAKARFERVFTVAGRPQWVRNAAIEVLDLGLGRIADATKGIDGDSAGVAAALKALEAARAGVATLIDDPEATSSAVASALRALTDLDGDPAQIAAQLDSLVSVFDAQPPVIGQTPTRVQQAANQAAVIALQRRTVVAELARAATRVELESSADAVALRDLLGARVQDEIDRAADAGDDETYFALSDLLAQSVLDLDARAARLPTLRTIDVPRALPALVIAYQVHGDAERESEIVARNRLVHPGFVSGAVEVLSDAG